MADGTFFFAWVDPTETTFGIVHQREDELIFSFELQHDEGQFCELTLEVANPYEGLLAPDRKLWAWFSWSDGTTVTPLFFGRILAIPDDLFAEIIKIKLVAKPTNYAAQQIALAHSLKVLPFYDKIFIDAAKDKEDDPNSVLEGYSALWHVDRITGLVTISDIITGEDGVVAFVPEEVFYDSVKATLAGAPLLMCEIEASVQWTQCGDGTVAFKTVPGLVSDPNPAPGITFGPGITFPADDFRWAKDPPQYTDTQERKNESGGPHQDGDLMEEKTEMTIPMYYGETVSHNESMTQADPSTGQGEEYSIKEAYKTTDVYWAAPAITIPGQPIPAQPTTPNTQPALIAAEVSQNRVEDIYVALRADVQPVLASLTLDQKDLTESLTINSRDLVEVGVLDTYSSAYFSTSRGRQSIEYLLNIARAHLLARARIFSTEWECPFPKLVASHLSCRKNATVTDDRLPGGTVLGKVVSYGMSGNGDTGVFVGKVNIQSAVGNYAAAGRAAGTPTAPGTPDYVDDSYVEYAYQHHTDALAASTTDDMSFEPLPFVQTGIQFPLTLDQILIKHEYNDAGTPEGRAIINEIMVEQSAAMNSFDLSNLRPAPPPPDVPVIAGQALLTPVASAPAISLPPSPITKPPAVMQQKAALSAQMNVNLSTAIFNNQSWVTMEFGPVQNVLLQVGHTIITTPLRVPRQINLAAT